MKKLLILGAGTAGTMLANRMSRALNLNEWKITIVDADETHYYQPGFLFIPFGIYSHDDVVRPKRNFLPANVEQIFSPIELIEPEHNRVRLANDSRGGTRTLDYDYLLIATGADVVPDETPGLTEHEWRRSMSPGPVARSCRIPSTRRMTLAAPAGFTVCPSSPAW
jgi:sulfide:quinone oxidoreductase